MREGEERIKKTTRKEIGLFKKLIADVGNVFQSIRIRCTFQINDGFDGFLLDYGRNFLLRFGSAIWFIFIVIELSK
jgi:hypothetical protein